MRVVVASDGSPSASIALQLTAAVGWGAGITIRVLEVVPRGAGDNWHRAAAERVDSAASALRQGGVAADGLVRYGAADIADGIAIEAAGWDADLVIAGSRPGSLVKKLLGSVAEALVDRAPCPVLVGRGKSCSQVLFADDGSESASEARQLLTRWPMFRASEVRVLSVAHTTPTMHSGYAPTMIDEAHAADAEMAAESRALHERFARISLDDLHRAGLRARMEVRAGDVADQILGAAGGSSSDLIVMGSHGRTGVTRALLGSVARDVLRRAECSVLIVRRG